MRVKPVFIRFSGASAILAVTLFATSARAAQEKVLHTFGEGMDGANPEAGLIADAHGNLYGTTESGGSAGVGTVFELSPGEGGSWTETVLHNFGGHDDGIGPAASLIFDASGNLYGTTNGGGTHGFGTVFELSPNGSGGWTETVLHSFDNNGIDGIYPATSLIRDSAGNLYGTTFAGGSSFHFHCDHQCGTVFELSPDGSGHWTEKVLHSFTYDDGARPLGGVIFDGMGNLYGTASEGGANNSPYGVVFELSPNGSGGWMETVLHNFTNKNLEPVHPEAGLIFDAMGNLYGTAHGGGSNHHGAVFEMSPNGSGGWRLKELHSFGRGDDGWYPAASVTFDAAGNLYGTTLQDGGSGHFGTVFELSPNGSGGWTEMVLHRFNHENGATPQAAVIVDNAGNVYSTARTGGSHNDGVVFEIEH